MLGNFDDLLHEADLFRNLTIGELTIGAGPLMAESIVGPAVGRLLGVIRICTSPFRWIISLSFPTDCGIANWTSSSPTSRN